MRLDSRDEFSLIIWDGKPRLSVAGVQDKINVVLNHEGQLGFGEGCNFSYIHGRFVHGTKYQPAFK